MAWRRERGIALIAVLWGLVLLAVIAASVATTTRTEIRLAHNQAENAKATALADAGVSRAVLGLLETVPERRLRADGTVYGWGFREGEVRVSIRDEGGKIDLNRSPEGVLRGLFLAQGLDEDESTALAHAIADFRDGNDTRRLHGAEDPDYRAAGLRHGAKDRPFEAVEELPLVLGMTRDLFERVAPALTVHSRRRAPNMASAPPEVLAALNIAIGSGPEGMRAMDEDVAEGGPEIEPLTASTQGATSSSPRGGAFAIRAEARTPSGAVFIREAVVRVLRGRSQPFRVLAWRRG